MKRLRGSYTIEAAYIMGITLFTFATVVGAAYRLKEETTEIMKLHEQVEILRHQEDQKDRLIIRHAGGSGWSLEITASVYDPESWLRMISLTEE